MESPEKYARDRKAEAARRDVLAGFDAVERGEYPNMRSTRSRRWRTASGSRPRAPGGGRYRNRDAMKRVRVSRLAERDLNGIDSITDSLPLYFTNPEAGRRR